jgi:hypothetical protein
MMDIFRWLRQLIAKHDVKEKGIPSEFLNEDGLLTDSLVRQLQDLRMHQGWLFVESMIQEWEKGNLNVTLDIWPAALKNKVSASNATHYDAYLKGQIVAYRKVRSFIDDLLAAYRAKEVIKAASEIIPEDLTNARDESAEPIDDGAAGDYLTDADITDEPDSPIEPSRNYRFDEDRH